MSSFFLLTFGHRLLVLLFIFLASQVVGLIRAYQSGVFPALLPYVQVSLSFLLLAFRSPVAFFYHYFFIL